MAIEDVKQLKTVNGQPQAQELLDAGWTLLAVCVVQGDSSQYAEYHLGRAPQTWVDKAIEKKAEKTK